MIYYTLLSLACSAVMGSCIGLGIFVSGWLFPNVKLLHVAIPLSAAAAIGALHGCLIGLLLQAMIGEDSMLRSEILRMVSGAGFAILATPIIVIRSAKMGARKGIRPPLESSPRTGDDRWDF